MGNLRILVAHNRYLVRGGEDQSHATEVHLLRDKGVTVDEFYRDNSLIKDIGQTSTALRTIWSQSTFSEIREVLRSHNYAFILVQNFFPLISPSIFYAAAAENVPVIQFLRNYRLLCLNAFLLRENKPCNDCVDKKFPFPGIVHRCYRNNFPGSSVVALMLYLHRLAGTWANKVDRYIALTNFSKTQFVKGGIPENKIAVRANFIYPDPGPGNGEGNYAVYVGRVSPEKGINVLLNAWETLGKRVPLKIVGEGDIHREVRGVEWVGKKNWNEVLSIIGRASMLVFPSLWYEGFGRSIIEAYAKGTPVIASKMGTMEELVIDGVTGYHFSPGDANDLIVKVEKAISDPRTLIYLRSNARKKYEEKFCGDVAFRKLFEIYENIRR